MLHLRYLIVNKKNYPLRKKMRDKYSNCLLNQ